MKVKTKNYICQSCIAHEIDLPSSPSRYWHVCPLSVELSDGNTEVLAELCDCCEDCVQQCYEDI